MQINPNANPQMIRTNGIKIIVLSIMGYFLAGFVKLLFPKIYVPLLIFDGVFVLLGLFLIVISYNLKKRKS